MFATRLARLETYWWQGTPGWVLRQSGVIHLPLEFDRKTQDARKIYLDHVKVLAKNPLRCVTLSEMNARIAARMHGQRRKPLEIMEVFQIVKKLWPKFVPDSPEESLDHPREFNVNYSRDKSLFERAPAPRPSPKSDTQAGPVAKTTAPSSAVPSVFHKVREPQTLPDGPIEPDFVYEQKQMSILGRWFLWALAKAEAIIGQPALEQPIAPEPVDVNAQQHEHAKDILTKMIAVMEQLKAQRRPAAVVVDPPPEAPTPMMSPATTTKIVSPSPSATPSPSGQTLRRAPISSPLEMTLPIAQTPSVNKISPPASASKNDPAKTNPENPAPPTKSTIGDDEAEELRRRKKEKRRLRLEAVAGLLITLGKSEDGIAMLDRHELQFKTVLVFDKLWRSLLDDPAPQRLAELQLWLDDQELEAPEWLHPTIETHESELNRELEAGPTRGNLPLLNTTGDILTR